MPDNDPIELTARAVATGAQLQRQDSLPLASRRDPGLDPSSTTSDPGVTAGNQNALAGQSQQGQAGARSPSVQVPDPSQANFNADAAEKAFKWATTSVRVFGGLCVVAGIVWGVFGILSWKVSRDFGISSGRAGIYGFCIDHKDTLPTEKDRQDCKIIIETTSIRDLSKGLYTFAASSAQQKHKRFISTMGILGSYTVNKTYSLVVKTGDVVIFFVLILDIAAYYPGILLPRWSTVKTFFYTSLDGQTRYLSKLIACGQVCLLWPFWLLYRNPEYKPIVCFLLVVAVYTHQTRHVMLLWSLLILNMGVAIVLNKLFIAQNRYIIYLHIVANIIDYFNAQVMIKFSYECATNRQVFAAWSNSIHFAWLTTIWVICGSPIDVASLTLYEPKVSYLLVIHRATCSEDCGYPIFSCQGKLENLGSLLSVVLWHVPKFSLLALIEPRLVRVLIFLLWESQLALLTWFPVKNLRPEDVPEQPAYAPWLAYAQNRWYT